MPKPHFDEYKRYVCRRPQAHLRCSSGTAEKSNEGREGSLGILEQKPLGFKFRRQHVYPLWVLDFYCHALKLAVEVDGSIHNLEGVRNADERRQKEIEMTGLTFLRFTNDQAEYNLEEVKQTIENFALSNRPQNENISKPKSPL